ncbi:glycosyltransferase [Leptolyngbya sp. AN02str]|uniref:glycosyltransferase n=1 Tax=Leptolyngbya sp. AN02str TaxID=3423363 RepID=UPI003D3201F7
MTLQVLTPQYTGRKPTLTIFYQFDPWNTTIGGIQTIIRTFIKYAPDEFNVQLVGTATNSSIALRQWHEQEYEGCVVRFMPLFMLQNDNVRGVIPTTLRYTAALAGQRFSSDFLHFHRLEPTLASFGWQGDKTLFIHNDIHKQMVSASGGKQAILWRHFPQAYFTLERMLVKQFSQIFSCNSESAQLYQQLYPQVADRVKLIRNTVDNDIFYPTTLRQKNERRLQLAKSMNLPEDTRFILFAGRLHPQKDPLLLVRSLAALNDPRVHLLIAGEGELADEIRAEGLRLQVSQHMTLLGAMNQQELADLHRLSSALVLTSIYEGLPLVVLEALACGTPIVTTNCGETPRLLNPHSGLVATDRTPDAIAESIRAVVFNPERFSTDGCLQAARPYSAQEVIHSIYSDMLHRWQPKELSTASL